MVTADKKQKGWRATTPCTCLACTRCRVIRHSIKKGARIRLADRIRPPRQDQKRRLKRILGILLVPEQPPAEAKHHRPVSPDQERERWFVLRRGEALKQLLIGDLVERTLGDKSVDV